MDILEHDHILLRALEPEDLDLLYKWENDSSIWHLSGTLVPYSRYVLKQYLQNAVKDIFEHKQLRLIIELKEENHAIGAIDLFDFDPFHQRAGVGILIAEQSDRGKGYAFEALASLKKYCFEVLGLHQLWCNISTENKVSVKLFSYAGFEVVGEKKDWIKTESGFENELLLQCVRS